MEEKTLLLRLSQIRLDGGTQSRAHLDSLTVEVYAKDLGDGAKFPAIVVFWDGKDYWLASGFHRWHAHQKAGRKSIEAIVKQGTVRDAKLYAVSCNAEHGKRRTPEDLSHALRILLLDTEWSKWSNREIGRRCKCEHRRVQEEKDAILFEMQQEQERKAKKAEKKVISSLVQTPSETKSADIPPSATPVGSAPKEPVIDDGVAYRTKHGTTAKMKTVNIGGQRVKPIIVETTPVGIGKMQSKVIRSIPKAVRQAKALGWTLERMIEEIKKVWDTMPVEGG